MRSKPHPGVTERDAVKSRDDRARSDEIAVEEPLEIRVAGDPLAVTMRTPGDDRLLAVGFLYAEGIIESIDDVGSVVHCGRPGEEGFGNVIDVSSAPGNTLAPERTERTRRGTLVSSACGVCGRVSIEDLVARCSPVTDESRVTAGELLRMGSSMRDGQPIFLRTGGVHAAALFDLSSGKVTLCEDIGRHNAVDKVVGRLLFDRALPAGGHALVVSGRASFEIVQKAARAGIPIVASVSAASSLAIDLALRMNITLASFVRDNGLTLYAHRHRVEL